MRWLDAVANVPVLRWFAFEDYIQQKLAEPIDYENALQEYVKGTRSEYTVYIV